MERTRRMGEKTLSCSSSARGLNFVRGGDDEFVEAGGLHARTFRDFTGGIANLSCVSAHGRRCFGQIGGNVGDFWLGIIKDGSGGSQHRSSLLFQASGDAFHAL